jgi:predicted Zn-dependent peptidase
MTAAAGEAATADAARDGAVEVTELRSADGPEPSIAKTVLPSGIRVVTERMPDARSVTTGVWVGVGSRDEPDHLAGASHFLEHLLFKGTEQRSARSIAVAIDAAGGEMNAFTSREHTAFYTRLPVDRSAFAIDLLTDVVANPAFRADEVEAEREVILEEIMMSEDAPDDVAMTALMDSLFPGHSVGRETLGTRASVEAMPRDAIASFHRDRYRPANLVVSAAGDVHHEAVVECVAGFLADVGAGERPTREPPGGEVAPRRVISRPTEQAHVAMGWRAMHYDDPDRYALWAANHIAGGGMSSRLFQEIREERGLAYTVYTSPSAYRDCGAVALYAGTSPGRLGELLEVVDDVLGELASGGVTGEELDVAVGFLEGSLLLGLEDTASRMVRLGSSEIARDEIISIEEHLARIRALTLDDVHRVLARVFGSERALVVVGPLGDDDVP